jgi:hypothetical protein
MDSMAYSRSYEPETRPDFHVYVSGQAKAWQAEYEATLEREATLKVLADVEALLKTL